MNVSTFAYPFRKANRQAKTTIDITPKKAPVMKYIATAIISVSLTFNALFFITVSQQMQEIEDLHKEVATLNQEIAALKQELSSCGTNGVKKMFNEYITEPIQHAYQAVKEKLQ